LAPILDIHSGWCRPCLLRKAFADALVVDSFCLGRRTRSSIARCLDPLACGPPGFARRGGFSTP
jgi:hypothetical protein